MKTIPYQNNTGLKGLINILIEIIKPAKECSKEVVELDKAYLEYLLNDIKIAYDHINKAHSTLAASKLSHKEYFHISGELRECKMRLVKYYKK